MKITFLLTTADAMGGTERVVFTLADLLARKHQVEVLSIFKTSSERFFTAGDTFQVRYLVDNTGPEPRPVRPSDQPQSLFSGLAALPSEVVDPAWEGMFNRLSDVELRTHLATTDTDAVIATTPSLMALLTRFAPEHILRLAQEHRVSELRGPSGAPLMTCAPLLDAMVALTEPTRVWFAESLGDAAPLLATIGNPQPEGFRPRSSGESRTILTAGRLVAEKQIDHAIRAFAAVADRHPDWSLRILGDGPKAKPLRQLAIELGIRDQVQFLGSTQDMPEEFAKASLSLMTSRNEAFPLVLMESLGSGVPVVSYACPNGPGEIITDGVDGTLVPVDDLDGLTAALDDLMGDSAKRRAFGEAGIRNIQRFSAEKITAQWHGLLESLEQDRRSGVREGQRAARMLTLAAVNAGGGPTPASKPAAALGVRHLDQKAQEVRLEALHDGSIVRAGGQICRVDDELFPFELMQANLDLVVDLATELGIPYVYTRTRLLRHSVAIAAEYQKKFISALVERYRDRPVYAALLNKRGAVSATSLASLLNPDSLQELPGLRLFEPVVTRSRTIRLGEVYGCTVAFWKQEITTELDPETGEEGAELSDTVVITGGTVFGPDLPLAALQRPATVRLGDKDYTTIEAFTVSLLDDVDFPVDAVYTWVNDQDPAWNERRNEALRARGEDTSESSGHAARFRDREELRYSLRSLDMYAPWIRTIYLVTDDQTPSWLDTAHPRVRVVSHREIFGDTGKLPTFNSHAIESRLHRIPGVSEHILYLNDDVFFGRPIKPEAFFSGVGEPKVFRSQTTVPPLPADDTEERFFAAAKNNRELVHQAFGRYVSNTYLHTPHPLLRSVLEELEQRFPEQVAATAAAQFRSPTDLAIPSSLHHSYALAAGKAVPGTIASGFVNIGLREQHPKLNALLSKRAQDVFCLNDFHDGDVSEEEQAEILTVFLASYFPTPSQFESNSVRNSRYV
ncbi:stealth conserved region 3 domain-containing protein [Streptacidiphilus sp. EB129]|uniref:stealth conserved region 3 domain-containing protein n=1 Tax=Streptacidiphilus sp. EB129 TaxID=3156262 RepID=UPI00351987D6